MERGKCRRKTEYWRSRIQQLRSDPRRAELGLYAANGTYYLFLSLGPLTALLLSVLPYTPVTEQRMLDGVLSLAPAPLKRLVWAVVRDVYAGSGAVLGLSAALELWSGSRFLASVVRSIGVIGGAPSGGYFRRRAMGAVYTAALLLFILFNLMLLLFGERLAALLSLDASVLRLRPLVVLAGLAAGNALLFARGGRGAMAHLPGALLSAAGWLAYTRAYSWALERFRLFGVYGSIAVVSASVVWMYGSLYILFFGAWLDRRRIEERGKGPSP